MDDSPRSLATADLRSPDMAPEEFSPSASPPPPAPLPPAPPAPEETQTGPRKDREEWSESAIATLIDAYTAKYGQLNGKGLRSKDWAEVVEAVNARQRSAKTVEHCRNKMDTLTKRYKSERKNKLAGGADSSWPWYHKMEIIRGRSPATSAPSARPPPPAPPPAKQPPPARVSKRGKKPQPEELPADPPPPTSAREGNGNGNGSAAPVKLAAPVMAWHAAASPPAAVVAAAAGHAAVPQMAAAAAAVRAACEPHVGGVADGDAALARSVAELAASLKAATGSLASSINGFTEVYARVEIAKMEMLKELELKRMQMQVETAEILRDSAAANKRKRETSSDAE